jgi:hypothetical protein
LNGTSAFAAVLRDRGYDARAAIRLNDSLAEWADGIVRFATYPGPPEKAEADWYQGWLAADLDRWLIYVARDFDAAPDYWKALRDARAEVPQEESELQAEDHRLDPPQRNSRLPGKPARLADPQEWFGVDVAQNPPIVCTKLDGPWSEGIDARAAALPVHEPLKTDSRCILLSGDGKPLVADKSLSGGARILIVASGSFLLNEALVNPSRWPLAERVADWPNRDGRRVALVEGSYPLEAEEAQTIWTLFVRVPALQWVAIQLGLAGLFAALARAPRLGRARPDPASAADRPAAHATAIGALLARAGALAEARDLLDRYRLWRHPQAAGERARAPARTDQRARLEGVPAPSALTEGENSPPAPDLLSGSRPVETSHESTTETRHSRNG